MEVAGLGYLIFFFLLGFACCFQWAYEKGVRDATNKMYGTIQDLRIELSAALVDKPTAGGGEG